MSVACLVANSTVKGNLAGSIETPGGICHGFPVSGVADTHPCAFPSLAALGTPYPAAAAQGWGGTGLRGKRGPPKAGKIG